MAAELYDLLIFLILLAVVALLILWAVKALFPAVYEPARYVVGGLALLALLIKLKPFIVAALS